MQEYLAKLRTKPRAVRERIAVGASLGITGVVALGWLAVMIVTNPFAVPAGPVAADNSEITDEFAEQKSTFQNLLGAVGASRENGAQSDIRIVDTTPDEAAPPAPTVIPF